jgi:hypothetical protein
MNTIYILTPILPSASVEEKIKEQLQLQFKKCHVIFHKSERTFEVNVLNADNKVMDKISEWAFQFLLNMLFQNTCSR